MERRLGVAGCANVWLMTLLSLSQVLCSTQDASAGSGTTSLGASVTSLAGPPGSRRPVDQQPGVRTDHVDLVELNHFVDSEGREVFRQLVFYDWSDMERRFHVRAWRLVKHDQQVPRQFWKPLRYETRWNDDGVTKVVRSKQFRETWSQQDPERTNRKHLPEDQRVPLFTK